MATSIAFAGPATVALLGSSASIAGIRQTITQLAGANLTVLLQGESGTGKEVVARLIGAHPGRAASFVKINCAAVPQELWESELFGYEAGAFTGANRQKSGKFELAEDGTLFLDEISEMAPHLQAKLLQVLQDGEFSRLGGQRSRSVDVRVIAASNIDLRAAVEAGTFRRDLYYRLNVISIVLPPLRERREDIAGLAHLFLAKYAQQYERRVTPLPDFALRAFEAYAWPGNVRELENLIKRYVILGDVEARVAELAVGASPGIAPVALVAKAAAGQPVATGSLLEIGRRAAWVAEREALLRTLAATQWNRKQAAKQLCISYKSLQNKLKTLRAEPAA